MEITSPSDTTEKVQAMISPDPKDPIFSLMVEGSENSSNDEMSEFNLPKTLTQKYDLKDYLTSDNEKEKKPPSSFRLKVEFEKYPLGRKYFFSLCFFYVKISYSTSDDSRHLV